MKGGQDHPRQRRLPGTLWSSRQAPEWLGEKFFRNIQEPEERPVVI